MRIAVDSGADAEHPLRPGMSVEATIQYQVRTDGHLCTSGPTGPALTGRGLPRPLPHCLCGSVGERSRAGGHQHRERGDSPHDGEPWRDAGRDRLGQYRLHRSQRHHSSAHQLVIGSLRAAELLHRLDHPLYHRVIPRRQRAHARGVDCCSGGPGHRWWRTDFDGPGHPVRRLPA